VLEIVAVAAGEAQVEGFKAFSDSSDGNGKTFYKINASSMILQSLGFMYEITLFFFVCQI
jgi:hypothetical protein